MFSHDGHYARRAAEEHVHRQAHATRWEAELLHQLHHDLLDATRILPTDPLEEVVGDGLDGQVGTGRVGLALAVEALVDLHLGQGAGVASGIGDEGLDGADPHLMSPSAGGMTANTSISKSSCGFDSPLTTSSVDVGLTSRRCRPSTGYTAALLSLSAT